MEINDDMNYLKRYVQNHPDNRMAWYLLGRQYIQEGKEAKANYCFLQSGSIYDAYERKQHPLANEPQQLIAEWNRKRRRRMLALRASASVLLLAALMLLIVPGAARDDAGSDEALQSVTDTNPVTAKPPDDGLKVVFVKPAGSDAAMLGKALGVLTQGGSQSDGKGLAVSLEQDGKWRKWTGKTRLLAQTAKQDGQGQADIGLLDAKACDCMPDKDAKARTLYRTWSERQEQKWTLSSAIAHYRERMKAWPAKLEDLVRPYPNNVLSGRSEAMSKLFAPLLKAMQSEAASAAGSDDGAGAGKQLAAADSTTKGAAAGAASSAAGESPLPEEPLSIVVDKDNHQLAVVSGDVIVRSYTVGLGGAKTPAGSFAISEKVRNPNGRDDSEFGSRGMTLSNSLYAIHGTNDPDSIGKDESHGCIRMNRKDLEELYDLVPLGTMVTIKSGVLPDAAAPVAKRFRLQPDQDETNSAVVYKWLD
ncbi:L,D-transpeptidase [Paenibacillus rhizovicinus]|uniref:L,D-transpeptidase n=1 Tax=Paenibacillus rhizovicinus TaxID=2704463 RepID=A0A6C0PC15_9BACL|nr:L,D-transpeptidase [Paenibacillus rhizovicinus]QHW34242.1 L,D-transpeptidase [Paenibacillus rhizovicinus]